MAWHAIDFCRFRTAHSFSMIRFFSFSSALLCFCVMAPFCHAQTFQILPSTTLASTETEDAKTWSGAGQIALQISDFALKNGNSPAVDLEFQVRQNFDSRYFTTADTARGAQVVHDETGLRPTWRNVKIELDDAFFGGRLEGGADLILRSQARDFAVRNFKITGYDVQKTPNWKRLLRLQKIETPSDLLLFRRGENGEISYHWRNIARVPARTKWKAVLRDWDGKILAQNAGELTFAAEDSAPIRVPFDARKWPLGVHSLTFSLFVGDEKTPVFERESYVGLASNGTLRKAKEGEFLYGLDAALGSPARNPRLMQWIELMGADILRHGYGWNNSLENVAQNLAVYDAAKLRTMYVLGPPVLPAHASRDEELLQNHVEFARSIARRFPQIRHYELGNEPDLFGFYRGPIESYARGMHVLARTLKTENPNLYVTNGGLSFAGEEGRARSERFVEVANTQFLDALAYHGHGPLVEAERAAFERMKKTALRYGKEKLPLVETESGVSAQPGNKAQEEIQARTVVQKMVYGQSQKMPLLLWFRLLMFEENYGNLRTEQEPRPVVLAYRNMVERLRGLHFQKTIEQSGETEAYFFAPKNSSAKTQTGALVIWKNSGEGVADFQLNGAKNARVFDLFGNAQPLAKSQVGTFSLPVSGRPQFLMWETTGTPIAERAPILLETAPRVQLLPDSENALDARVRNPFGRKMFGRLEVRPMLSRPHSTPQSVAFATLKAKDEMAIRFPLRVEKGEQIEMPRAWTTWVHIDPTQLDLASISRGQTPQNLAGEGGKTVASRQSRSQNGILDFEREGGKLRERAAALAVGTVQSPREQTVNLGAGGDWWMQLWLNGEMVYSTLERGNGGGLSIGNHTFPVKLKQGANTLAVLVLSGSHGWKLALGGPNEVEKLRAPGAGDKLVWTWSEPLPGGKYRTLARQISEVAYTQPLEPLRNLSAFSLLSEWENRAPTVVLGGEAVQNEWAKTPWSERWWRGDDDLSARIWLAGSGENLAVVARVRDDELVAATSAQSLRFTDAMHLQISRDGENISRYSVAQIGEKIVVLRQKSGDSRGPQIVSPSEASGQIERDEQAKTTIYRLNLTAPTLRDAEFRINVQIADNDPNQVASTGPFSKQILSWSAQNGETPDPQKWLRTRLSPIAKR